MKAKVAATKRPPQQRQGSSFLACPACGAQVHSALLSFHMCSCPVVTSTTTRHVPPPAILHPRHGKENNLPASSSSPREEETGDPERRASNDSDDAVCGTRRLFPQPESPIRVPDKSFDGASPPLVLISEEEERKRLFEDWGQQLSPGLEPPASEKSQLKSVNLPCETIGEVDSGEAHSALGNGVSRPSIRGPEEQEMAACNRIGKLPKAVESQSADKDFNGTASVVEEIGSRERETGLEMALKELREKYDGAVRREREKQQALEASEAECKALRAREVEAQKAFQREEGLKKALQELREEHDDTLRTLSSVRSALRDERQACMEASARKQETHSEVFSLLKKLEQQTSKHDQDEEAEDVKETQLLMNNTQQEFNTAASIGSRADFRNVLQMSASLTEEAEVKATQLLSQQFNNNASSSPNPGSSHHPHHHNSLVGENSTHLFRGETTDQPTTNMTQEATGGSLFSVEQKSLKRSRQVVADHASFTGLAPQTPGKGLKLTDDLNSGLVQECLAEKSNAHSYGTMGSERAEGKSSSSPREPAPQTPGKLVKLTNGLNSGQVQECLVEKHNAHSYGMAGNERVEGKSSTPLGPDTPEKIAIIRGAREKGLISDLLHQFPPAQGTETQGIDPFEEQLLDDANALDNDSHPLQYAQEEGSRDADILLCNVAGGHSNPHTTPLHSRQSPEAELLTEKCHEQTLARTLKSRKKTRAVVSDADDSAEDGRLEQTPALGLKCKRRRPALVVDSDSDGVDSGSGKRITERKFGTAAVTGSTEDIGHQQLGSHPADHVQDVSEGSAGPGQKIPVSFSQAVPDSQGNSEAENQGNSLDPIIEILKRSLMCRSPPALVKNLFPSDGEENAGGGRHSKRRRITRVKGPPPSTNDTQRGPDVDEIEDSGQNLSGKSTRSREAKDTTGPKIRRSERLMKKRAVVLSDEDEEGQGSLDGSRTTGRVRDDDDEIDDIDSDFSELGVSRKRPSKSHAAKLKKRTPPNPKKRAKVLQYDPCGNKMELDDEEDEYEDDIDDDSFINDDSEWEPGTCSQSSTPDSCSDGEGSESSSERVRKRRGKKFHWELEGEMLAALAKDDALCLRGVCALYRRQEEDERQDSDSKYRNKRGFDKFQSARASKIAKYLMGCQGNSDEDLGPVVKTPAQLEAEMGVDTMAYCSDLCSHHSKQLFEIYQNKEDPDFPVATTITNQSGKVNEPVQ